MAKRILSSERQTQELAQELIGQHLKSLEEKALFFALEGDLGAGKTTFTKGLGNFLKVGRPIRSPGYILVTEYPYTREQFSGKIFHVDLWRVQDLSEVLTLNLKDLLEPGNILVIEWSQKIPQLIDGLISNPKKVKTIRLHFDQKGENEREVEIEELS